MAKTVKDVIILRVVKLGSVLSSVLINTVMDEIIRQ
jgi:hypothetical protein